MKAVEVDIHEELTSSFVEEEQKLNVSVVDYISPESKTKSRQSRVNKTHNSRCPNILRSNNYIIEITLRGIGTFINIINDTI